MRAINADELLYPTDGNVYVKHSQEYGDVVQVCDIVYAPTVEVPERNVGKWIFWDKNRVMCSECKVETYAGKGADGFKYCPHCGAKMEVSK